MSAEVGQIPPTAPKENGDVQNGGVAEEHSESQDTPAPVPVKPLPTPPSDPPAPQPTEEASKESEGENEEVSAPAEEVKDEQSAEEGEKEEEEKEEEKDEEEEEGMDAETTEEPADETDEGATAKEEEPAPPAEKEASPPPKTEVESPKKTSPKKESPSKASPTKPKVEAKSPGRKPKALQEKKEEAGEPKTPVMEQPLVVEGKRNRKSVERWTLSTTASAVKEFAVPEGSGTKLGEIEFVESMISKTSTDDLKTLHRLCFGTVGKATLVKRHLRQFSGFDFTGDSENGKKKLKILEGMQQKHLKQMCDILGVEKGKNKEEIVANLHSFFLNPADTGKKAPAKKRGAKRSRSKSGGKRKRSSKKEKKEGEEGTEGADGDSSDKSGDESGEEEEEEEEEEEKEAEPPAKKAKTPAASSSTPFKGRGRPKKGPAPKLPSDTELRTAIKKLLKGINLETVTMKEMCKKVYDHFPDADLAAKKDFIKSTVKEIISSSD